MKEETLKRANEIKERLDEIRIALKHTEETIGLNSNKIELTKYYNSNTSKSSSYCDIHQSVVEQLLVNSKNAYLVEQVNLEKEFEEL